MTTWAVLATGPSMSQAVADSVKGRCKAVTVSDSFRLAGWADALAATDAKWWQVHKEAKQFAGRRFTAAPDFMGLPEVERLPGASTGTNSGLLGVMTAVHLGATRVLICGLDLRNPGQHFFGKHPTGLRSSSQRQLDTFKKQFLSYRPRGIEIINCTPGSALDVYPRRTLEDCLSESPVL